MLLQITLWGLYAGCIYILLATGLNLIFGVMKVVNFAHGEFLMLAAYITYWLHNYSGLNPYYVIPASMLILALTGLVIERLCFRPIMGTGKLNEIFLSLGLIYLLQNLAAFLWTTNSRSIRSPFAEAFIPVAGTTMPLDYLIIIFITITFLAALYVFMKKTDVGRAIRATSQNREAAKLMGINVEKMDMLSFALGSALAATGGSLLLISGQMVNPYMGSILALKAFAVIIVGGLGSIPGAVIAGFTLGIAENLAPFVLKFFAEQIGYQSISFMGWKDTIAFFVLILVLVIRPEGLFGEAGE